jgi:hypothetical protein
MEPSAERAEPRIYWLKEFLAHETLLLQTKKEEVFYFDTAPTCIQMDKNNDCLNYRLFGGTIDGSKPSFEKSIHRSHLACVKRLNSPISMDQVMTQLSKLEAKRGRKGTYQKKRNPQISFRSIDEKW